MGRAYFADLISCEFSSPLVGINIRLLADESANTTANTTDCREGDDHLLPAVDVGVQHTKNVLKISHIGGAERHFLYQTNRYAGRPTSSNFQPEKPKDQS